jgi:hypothetical protein
VSVAASHRISVEDPGAPNLGDGAPHTEGPVPGGAPSVSGPAPQAVVEQWTAEEFASFEAGWLNLLLMPYGPQAVVDVREIMPFAGHGALIANRFFPKGGDGTASLLVAIAGVLGGTVTVLLSRREVLARGPLSKEQMAAAWGMKPPASPPPTTPGATPPRPAPAQPPGSDETPANSGGYKLPDDLRAFADGRAGQAERDLMEYGLG